MKTRMIAAAALIAALIAALALGGVAGAVSAQEPAEEPEPAEQSELRAPESEAVAETLIGTIVLQQTELGRMVYFLDRGDGQLVELRFGPAWFWGELNPLHVLAATQASIGVERATGKPPWAGGPKVQGEVHPGYEGWSHGQANKAANKPVKPPKPDKPVKPPKPDKPDKPAKPSGPWPLPADEEDE